MGYIPVRRFAPCCVWRLLAPLFRASRPFVVLAVPGQFRRLWRRFELALAGVLIGFCLISILAFLRVRERAR